MTTRPTEAAPQPSPESSPEQPADEDRAVRRARRRRVRRWIVALVLIALIPPGVSYERALVYPGNASFLIRTVEWVRDHGGAPLVDLAENVYYGLKAPPDTAPDAGALPKAAAPAATAPAPLGTLSGTAALPGEGVWQPGPALAGGTPGLYTTFIRPDAGHASVVAGVARFDQHVVGAHLIPGTKEPSGLGWPEGGKVPAALRAGLVATFNSGFKMKDANGGFLADGRTAVSLRDGAASMVIDKTGHVTIGRWGRDVTNGPDVAAVRQNLALIIENGKVVPGLDFNSDNSWGSTASQLQYTWRSGVGIDTDGNLIYVGGNQMNLSTLAAALSQAGAVTAMELDIHGGMVDLFSYAHDGAGQLAGTPLLPTMPGSTNRYLVTDQRDFFAITAR
jgi:hypothetical protein